MRDSVIFYRSFYEAIKELPLDVQGQVYSAVFEYSLNFNEVSLQGLPKTIFTLIKPQLDANNRRFENGKKGGRKKQNETEKEPKPNQKETKIEANNNNNVNDNVNINDNVILLEKETKEEFIENSEIESLQTEKEKEKKVPPKKEKEINLPDGFSEIWDLWLEYRKANKIKKYASDKFEQMAIDKLVNFSNGNPQIANQIINESITNNWTGFFKLKDNYNGQQQSTTTNVKQQFVFDRSKAVDALLRVSQNTIPENP